MEVNGFEGRQRCARDVEKQRIRLKTVTMLIAVIACIAFFLFRSEGNKQEGELQAGSEEEARLEEALEAIQGVGRVKVYFHYEGQKKSETSTESELFSQYFRQQEAPQQEMSGLLVVAEGADDVFIRNELMATISRILQMPTHRIVIVPMKEEEEVENES